MLALDARRTVVQGLADDSGTAVETQRRHRGIDGGGHRLGRIGVDDDDRCTAHAPSLAHLAALEHSPEPAPTRDAVGFCEALIAENTVLLAGPVAAMPGARNPATQPRPVRRAGLLGDKFSARRWIGPVGLEKRHDGGLSYLILIDVIIFN